MLPKTALHIQCFDYHPPLLPVEMSTDSPVSLNVAKIATQPSSPNHRNLLIANKSDTKSYHKNQGVFVVPRFMYKNR